MKGFVADLVVRTHRENGLPGSLDGSVVDLCAFGARAASASMRTFGC
jgi:hypothetical protein